MPPEEIKRLRELCEKATKGEWFEDCGCVEDVCGISTIATCGHGGIVIEQYRADARFIAASRTALPSLLDEVERLTRRVAQLESLPVVGGESADGYCVAHVEMSMLGVAVPSKLGDCVKEAV